MERSSSEKPSISLVGLILRIIAVALTLILIGLAAATIGLIRNNQPLIDQAVNTDPEDNDEVALLFLLANTQRTASWLIFLAVCVLIGEFIAILLLILRVVTGRLVLHILETIFSFIVAFLYLSTGVVFALYASQWAATPEGCKNEELDCIEVAFTAINSLQAAFCFVQMVNFSVIGIWLKETL